MRERDLNLPENITGARLGLMGGTFDPIHTGHLITAESARDELGLDGVLFMPTGCSYLKEGRKIADREDRYNMIALAVKGNPFFFVSRMEIDRPGNTHTADTLRELNKIYPGNEWFLIVGADALMLMDIWVEPEVIFGLSTVVCADRGETGEERLKEKKAQLERDFGAKIELLSMGRVDISSSDIRGRISAGKSVKYELPEAVIDYISKRGLYRA